MGTLSLGPAFCRGRAAPGCWKTEPEIRSQVLGLLLGAVLVPSPSPAPDELRSACGDRHRVDEREVPLEEYVESGLQTETMGRRVEDDRLFFTAALAAGDAVGEAALPGVHR